MGFPSFSPTGVTDPCVPSCGTRALQGPLTHKSIFAAEPQGPAPGPRYTSQRLVGVTNAKREEGRGIRRAEPLWQLPAIVEGLPLHNDITHPYAQAYTHLLSQHP